MRDLEAMIEQLLETAETTARPVHHRPGGRLMLTVLSDLAEFKRELIRNRTSEGRERAKAKGVVMGRKPKLMHHQCQKALPDGKPARPWGTSAVPTTSATALSAGYRLRQRFPQVDDGRIGLSRGAASQKDRAQRSDNGENEHDDGCRKMPL
jgi:hypothetical protein